MLARVSVLVFLRAALQPNMQEAVQAWLAQQRWRGGGGDQPPGGGTPELEPRLSARDMGYIDCSEQIGLFVGVVLYYRFCAKLPYSTVLCLGQVVLAASSGVLELWLLRGWPQAWASDTLLAIGARAVPAAADALVVVPLWVLACRSCPDRLEATAMSLLLVLATLGSSIASFSGGALADVLGVGVAGDFKALPIAITTSALCRLLPLPLFFLLAPPGLTPADPVVNQVMDNTEVSCELPSLRGGPPPRPPPPPPPPAVSVSLAASSSQGAIVVVPPPPTETVVLESTATFSAV